MKKFLLTALAATVAISPIAATAATAAEAAPYNRYDSRYDRGRDYAQNRGYDYSNRHYNDRGYNNRGYNKRNYRHWQKGQRFDRRYAQNYRQVDYRQYRQRGLYAPPRGYQWAQSGNDAVLIAVASGLIGAVLGGALR